MDTKICSKCKTRKDLDDFTKRASSKDGRTSECRSCRKEYRKNAKSRINDTKRRYYKTYLTNDKVKETIEVRRRLRTFVSAISRLDETATIDHLGCGALEFATYLQQQAVSNGYDQFDIYNYDRSVYHLDHKRPLKLYIEGKATLEELSHYTNVQILTKYDNLIKGDK